MFGVTRCFTTACWLWLLFLIGNVTQVKAAPGDLQLSLDAGAGGLSGAQGKRWGAMGGLSLDIEIWDTLHFATFVDRKDIFRGAPDLSIFFTGATLRYYVDVAWVAPFFGIGPALTSVHDLANEKIHYQLTPLLSLGVDLRLWRPLILGIEVRYASLYQTSLLSNPAYVTIHGRLGIDLSD